MKLGIDLSIQDELDELNPKYTYQGKEIEPFHFFAEHSHVDMVRLRLWNNPHDEEGRPYGGGTNDLATFLRLAKRAKKEGMEVMLDFHYSDFWADPSHQQLPKAWLGLKSIHEAEAALYQYTRATLVTVKASGIDLVAIQVGNEITHGMSWPFGETWNEFSEERGGGFDGLAILLKAGIKACREIYPEAKIVLHLEHSGSFDMQEGYWDKLLDRGVDFDVMGESYYPYWHGPFSMFEDCVGKLIAKYKKEVWVVELGYQYEPTINPDYSEVKDAKEGDFIIGNVNGRIPFPQSKQGQAEYVGMMLGICKRLGVGAVCYWEPTWIYVPGNGWGKEPGQRYLGFEPAPAGNAWAIETFFDQQGEANPVVEVFTKQYVNSLK